MNQKRLILILGLTVWLIATAVMTVGAESAVNVEVDGQAVALDVQPFVNEDNRTLVPLRAPMEALGATVNWDQANQVASIIKGDITVAFTVNQKTYTINGVSTNMDTAAILTSGRVLIPIKYAAEALGATVAWNSESKTVVITSAPEVATPPADNPPVQDEDQTNSGNLDIARVIAAAGPGKCDFNFSGVVKAETLGYPIMPYSLVGTATLAANKKTVEAVYVADLQPINAQPSTRTCEAFPYLELIAGPQEKAEKVINGYTLNEAGNNWVISVADAEIPESVLTLFSNVYHGVYWKELHGDLVITIDKTSNKVISVDCTNMKGIAVNDLFGGQPIDLPSEGTGQVSYTY